MPGLDVPSFDGERRVRVFQGKEAVGMSINNEKDPPFNVYAGIVLTPADARELAAILIRRADDSERVE